MSVDYLGSRGASSRVGCLKQLPKPVFQLFHGLPQGAELPNPHYSDGRVQVKRWGTQYFHGVDRTNPGNKASRQQPDTITIRSRSLSRRKTPPTLRAGCTCSVDYVRVLHVARPQCSKGSSRSSEIISQLHLPDTTTLHREHQIRFRLRRISERQTKSRATPEPTFHRSLRSCRQP